MQQPVRMLSHVLAAVIVLACLVTFDVSAFRLAASFKHQAQGRTAVTRQSSSSSPESVSSPLTATLSPSSLSMASSSSSSSASGFSPMTMMTMMSDEEEEGEEGGEDEEVPTPNPVIEEAPMSLFKEGISFPTTVNGSDVRVGIIMARWNADIIGGLYKGVNESLTACGVKPSNVFSTYVPGAFELPITAKFLAMSKRVDVIICLGCLIKGDTMHFEYIASATSQGIMTVALESLVPVVFGVLTVLDKQQAVVRSTGEKNEGLSWGTSAVEMGLARMSALGVGVKPEKDSSKTSGFVTFNATAGAAAAGDKGKDKGKEGSSSSSGGSGDGKDKGKGKGKFGF